MEIQADSMLSHPVAPRPNNFFIERVCYVHFRIISSFTDFYPLMPVVPPLLSWYSKMSADIVKHFI